MARFDVTDAFTLQRGNLFVLTGDVAEGRIAAGMVVHLPFDGAPRKSAPLVAVEQIRRAGREEVALCIECRDAEELRAWGDLKIESETIEVAATAHDGVADPAWTSAGQAAKRASRYAVLFVSLLALIVVPPLLGTSGLASLILGVLVTLLLIGAVVAAAQRRYSLWLAIVLVAPPLVVNGLSMMAPESSMLEVLRLVVVSSFLVVAVLAILADVLGPGEVDLRRILGALCVYLLFGLIWAFLFALVDRPPGAVLSFPPYLIPTGELGLSRYTYFSFVTLTTLGYGDVVPIAAAARGLAVVEAVIGPLYLAVLVARLVALYVGQRSRS